MTPWPCCSAAMVWVVYKASFTTHRGTRRWGIPYEHILQRLRFSIELGLRRRASNKFSKLYFGCTRNPEGREEELQNPGSRQPAWLNAGCRDFSYEILVPDCRSKSAALAIEALVTAHSWRRQPHATRGGPWVLPMLPAADTRELQAAAACNNLPL